MERSRDSRLKDDEPAEGARENLNVEPGEDTEEDPPEPGDRTTAEQRDHQAQVPRGRRRPPGERTTL